MQHLAYLCVPHCVFLCLCVLANPTPSFTSRPARHPNNLAPALSGHATIHYALTLALLSFGRRGVSLLPPSTSAKSCSARL